MLNGILGFRGGSSTRRKPRRTRRKYVRKPTRKHKISRKRY